MLGPQKKKTTNILHLRECGSFCLGHRVHKCCMSGSDSLRSPVGCCAAAPSAPVMAEAAGTAHGAASPRPASAWQAAARVVPGRCYQEEPDGRKAPSSCSGTTKNRRNCSLGTSGAGRHIEKQRNQRIRRTVYLEYLTFTCRLYMVKGLATPRHDYDRKLRRKTEIGDRNPNRRNVNRVCHPVYSAIISFRRQSRI